MRAFLILQGCIAVCLAKILVLDLGGESTKGFFFSQKGLHTVLNHLAKRKTTSAVSFKREVRGIGDEAARDIVINYGQSVSYGLRHALEKGSTLDGSLDASVTYGDEKRLNADEVSGGLRMAVNGDSWFFEEPAAHIIDMFAAYAHSLHAPVLLAEHAVVPTVYSLPMRARQSIMASAQIQGFRRIMLVPALASAAVLRGRDMPTPLLGASADEVEKAVGIHKEDGKVSATVGILDAGAFHTEICAFSFLWNNSTDASARPVSIDVTRCEVEYVGASVVEGSIAAEVFKGLFGTADPETVPHSSRFALLTAIQNAKHKLHGKSSPERIHIDDFVKSSMASGPSKPSVLTPAECAAYNCKLVDSRHLEMSLSYDKVSQVVAEVYVPVFKRLIDKLMGLNGETVSVGKKLDNLFQLELVGNGWRFPSIVSSHLPGMLPSPSTELGFHLNSDEAIGSGAAYLAAAQIGLIRQHAIPAVTMTTTHSYSIAIDGGSTFSLFSAGHSKLGSVRNVKVPKKEFLKSDTDTAKGSEGEEGSGASGSPVADLSESFPNPFKVSVVTYEDQVELDRFDLSYSGELPKNTTNVHLALKFALSESGIFGLADFSLDVDTARIVKVPVLKKDDKKAEKNEKQGKKDEKDVKKDEKNDKQNEQDTSGQESEAKPESDAPRNSESESTPGNETTSEGAPASEPSSTEPAAATEPSHSTEPAGATESSPSTPSSEPEFTEQVVKSVKKLKMGISTDYLLKPHPLSKTDIDFASNRLKRIVATEQRAIERNKVVNDLWTILLENKDDERLAASESALSVFTEVESWLEEQSDSTPVSDYSKKLKLLKDTWGSVVKSAEQEKPTDENKKPTDEKAPQQSEATEQTTQSEPIQEGQGLPDETTQAPDETAQTSEL